MRWGYGTDGPKRGWNAVWHKSFAVLPKQCVDGTWVWLEPVERIDYMARSINIHAIAHHAVFGTSWCYRIPEEPTR